MRLEWSPLAMDDRERIFDFIEQDDPRAAIAVDERIAAQMLVLVRFPEGGRPGRIEGTRELIVRRTPYIVAYRVGKDRVRILRILHSAQLWPGELP
ncbi:MULTISPECIES: type II toxin-antitoxin system RelE/ParE family toxin [unclassified Variovorax]|uniref:type II toxin-antitoxin system RelE/ParE family toxin n=1 Tax=unclassified Variovorax TaxID=663243 RepID=UPI003F463390